MTSISNQVITKQAIVDEAQLIGFDIVRFTSASLPKEKAGQLLEFLDANRHGDMDWMERRTDERSEPASLWPAAKSVIVLGVNYGPDENPLDKLNNRTTGNISVYAHNKDYHDFIKKNLKKLARSIVAQSGAEVKVFVDTAPVMEKPLAAQAGAGWQGKHTNLVSREFGSWLFLGEIFTTLPLEPDTPENDHCGSCQQCLDICPTKAFPAPYQLDARRCISYLTIEHKGAIPVEFRRAIGNRIYGCDDCLAICPWNKFATLSAETRLHAREELTAPALRDLAQLDDVAFRKLFSGSPIKRTGRDRFLRNVLIALGNAGEPEDWDVVERLLTDHSPLVRGAAVWALQNIDPAKADAIKPSHYQAETDTSVCAEWMRPSETPGA